MLPQLIHQIKKRLYYYIPISVISWQLNLLANKKDIYLIKTNKLSYMSFKLLSFTSGKKATSKYLDQFKSYPKMIELQT